MGGRRKRNGRIDGVTDWKKGKGRREAGYRKEWEIMKWETKERDQTEKKKINEKVECGTG